MKNYSFGTIAGIASLVLVPLLASAASSVAGTPEDTQRERPVPSQECLQAQVAKHDLMAAGMDETMAARKAAMQVHRDALDAAAAIADDAGRQTAVQQANEAFRTSMQTLIGSKSDEMQAAMEAMRDACGGFGPKGGMGAGLGGGMGGGRMMDGHGRGQGMRGGQGDCPFRSGTSDE